MSTPEKLIGIAAKLYEARATMRQLLSDRYADRMRELGDVIKKVQARDSVNEIEAAQTIIRAIDAQGFDALQLLAAAVELVEPTAVKYWHGGPAGLKPGNLLLPPCITKAASCSEFGAAHVHRRDRVYITTRMEAALVFAAGHKNGVVYECEPVGSVSPDPDCNTPGLSFECEKARVIRCIKPGPQALNAARVALFSAA